MAGLKINGDLSQISEIQLNYIKSVIEKQGFTNNNVTIEAIGKAGDNYVANVKKIIVDDGKGGTFKMVAKIAPLNEIMRQMGNTELVFRNEHIMYTKVLPKFTQLEKAAEISPEDRLRYAACYGSSNDPPNEVILLEDLSESSYAMLDRFKPLRADAIKSVLKNFAKLHSLSYALKKNEPELFDEYKNSLIDVWELLNGQIETAQYFQQLEANADMIVADDVYKKAINGAVTNAMKSMRKIIKYDKQSKFSIIQQGDSWTNNIMFKLDGELLLGSIMIDYQLSKASHPVGDILYMILNCTDHKMRKENFNDWIDYYHSELDKSLANFGLKANFVYPRDQLDVDLKQYGKIYFGLSLMLASMLSLKTEEASAVKDAMESADIEVMIEAAKNGIKDPQTSALVKQRVEDLVDSCHEFGLI